MGQTWNRMDERWSRTDRTGVIMDNRNILDIGSIISEINLGTASKFGRLFQEKDPDQDENETIATQVDEYEDRGSIGDYEVVYQEICHLLDNIKQKWGTDDIEHNILNTYYHRDLLYLYDRITLDMNYLNGHPERNNGWLEKLLELKYEIRNLM